MSKSTQISGIKKARKINHIEHDHISSLPDCVISHILSRLPTKDAMRTSVLSKYWKYKWTSIYNIELVDRDTFRNVCTFANFIERTFPLLQNLQSLRLASTKKHDLHRMKTWISAALSPNLQYLEIFYYITGIVLPCDLLNCYSLRKLKLAGNLKISAAICLPQLTTLCLVDVEILNESSTSDPVKFNLPVLETLVLMRCKWLNVKLVEIYAPKMTTFMSSVKTGGSDYSIKITGESLVKFKCYGDLAENIVLSGPAVVYATLENRHGRNDARLLEKSGLQIRKLLNGFSNIKDLKLSGLVGKAIALSRPRLPLPRYCRMEQLILDFSVNDSFGSTEVLLELLHAMPFLKVLHIKVFGWKDYDYDAEEIVPSCIVSHLKEVMITSFDGKMNQLKLVKFFLKNALQLKIIQHRADPNPLSKEERYEITKELYAYPKASANVIVFNHF